MDKEYFQKYIEVFLRQNSVLNLISKNEEHLIWEKHIYDSLNIGRFFEKYGVPENILDIGTGGGFPAVPAAIAYPNIEVWALDSISKKIRAIDCIKQELNLTNLHTICSRIEKFNDMKFELVTSRAVAPLNKLLIYAEKCTRQGGYFIAYKSKGLENELEAARLILNQSKFNLIDTIEYSLPTKEKHIRKLAVFRHI